MEPRSLKLDSPLTHFYRQSAISSRRLQAVFYLACRTAEADVLTQTPIRALQLQEAIRAYESHLLGAVVLPPRANSCITADHDGRKSQLVTRSLRCRSVEVVRGPNHDDTAEVINRHKGAVFEPGSNGGWTTFLEAASIPKHTADCYVANYGSVVEPQGNLAVGKITDGGAIMTKEVSRLSHRFRKIFDTPETRQRFPDQLADKLMERETSEGTLFCGRGLQRKSLPPLHYRFQPVFGAEFQS